MTGLIAPYGQTQSPCDVLLRDGTRGIRIWHRICNKLGNARIANSAAAVVRIWPSC